jgi:hypothetical protein
MSQTFQELFRSLVEANGEADGNIAYAVIAYDPNTGKVYGSARVSDLSKADTAIEGMRRWLERYHII